MLCCCRPCWSYTAVIIGLLLLLQLYCCWCCYFFWYPCCCHSVNCCIIIACLCVCVCVYRVGECMCVCVCLCVFACVSVCLSTCPSFYLRMMWHVENAMKRWKSLPKQNRYVAFFFPFDLFTTLKGHLFKIFLCIISKSRMTIFFHFSIIFIHLWMSYASYMVKGALFVTF